MAGSIPILDFTSQGWLFRDQLDFDDLLHLQ